MLSHAAANVARVTAIAGLLQTAQQMLKVKFQRLVEQFGMVYVPIWESRVESVENVLHILVRRRSEAAPVILI